MDGKIFIKHIQLDTLEEAQAVKALLDEGADFEETLRKYSKCISATNATSQMIYTRGSYEKDYEDVVLSLQEGEYSDPVKTIDQGYKIILRDYDTRVWYSFRHILLETPERATRILEKINEGAEFEVLAEKHSKCSSGKKHEGHFTQVHTGMLEPELEKKILELEVGEMTGPIESKFGFHVIQRTS